MKNNFTTHTVALYTKYVDAMRHFVLTEDFHEGQDTEARVLALTRHFFSEPLTIVRSHIAGHKAALKAAKSWA